MTKNFIPNSTLHLNLLTAPALYNTPSFKHHLKRISDSVVIKMSLQNVSEEYLVRRLEKQLGATHLPIEPFRPASNELAAPLFLETFRSDTYTNAFAGLLVSKSSTVCTVYNNLQKVTFRNNKQTSPAAPKASSGK